MALTVPVSEIVEKSLNPLLGKHDSWRRVLLGDIATVQNGYAFKSSLFTRESGTPLIRIRDVGKDKSETYYSGDYPEEYLVESGDLLIGMDGDFNCARWRGPSSLLNQRVCRIKVISESYVAKFLDYVLPSYLQAIHDVTSSVTVKHLSSKTIKEIPLPLPPFEQQNLLVEEIEKQFSRLDEAVANLKRVKANLKRYKASVLQAAVTGRLTEEWRKNNLDVEPASKLLERILTERRKKWEETELAKLHAKGLPAPKDGVWWLYVILCDDDSFYIGATGDMPRRWSEHTGGKGAEWTKKHHPVCIIHHEKFSSQADAYNREKELKTGFGRKWLKREYANGRLRQAGKEPKNDKWKEKYKEPSYPDTSELHSLPEGWEWASLESVSEAIGGYAFKSKDFSETGHQVVKMANIKMAKLDLSKNPSFITDVDENIVDKYRLIDGDVLITLTGTRNKRDYGYIVQVKNPEVSILLNQRIARLRPIQRSSSDFLTLVLQSEGFRNRFFNHETGNVGQGNIGVKAVTIEPIFFPPFEEQQMIMLEVESKLSVAEELERIVDVNLKRLERLRQSILKQAFAGKLV